MCEPPNDRFGPLPSDSGTGKGREPWGIRGKSQESRRSWGTCGGVLPTMSRRGARDTQATWMQASAIMRGAGVADLQAVNRPEERATRGFVLLNGVVEKRCHTN